MASRSIARAELKNPRAFGRVAPAFFHAPLLCDEKGVRLAKRHDALALRTLRAQGMTPAAVRKLFDPGSPG